MAEALQREFSLPVVKVRLVELAAAPAVQIELVVNVEGKQQIVSTQTQMLDEFGFTDSLGREDPQLRVPDTVVRWVSDWVEDQLTPDNVLWLHLVKPYGQLGAVPWERHIGPACQIPVLRLPDALPDEERASSTFQVALCATMPAPDGHSTAVQMVPPAARALAAAVGDRLRLHVFPDPDAHDALEHALSDLAQWVTIYRPEPDFDAAVEPTTGLENLWLRWMRQAMGARTFDAVHFITHGYALGTDGAILTTSTPTSIDRMHPQKVQAGELRSFLTYVGSLVAGFSAPLDNYSDYGLLKIVDELGALRAGPVLLHDARGDREMAVLGSAYGFLSAQEPARPPADSSLVLFAQPRQVAGVDQPARAVGDEERDLLLRSDAVATHFSRDETPAWVGASERYIREYEADLIRFEQSKAQQAPTSGQAAYYAGVESALHKIRAVVNEHAERQLWQTSS